MLQPIRYAISCTLFYATVQSSPLTFLRSGSLLRPLLFLLVFPNFTFKSVQYYQQFAQRSFNCEPEAAPMRPLRTERPNAIRMQL